ncbi:precorrin-2 dehydrogenase/sirohydrochlorin ferrochelatase family protein [Natronosalvus halobius]|uniref:precorrin-2 dehydrogenase/sirohydrochlorin ferrochelatase family protein n=1 Tax=Natronosalvus halobius TaxID=2953746 RepID=UPI0020A1818C|nr:bifunctional precorrin-2 dehydrogenase/sirohydrochlorin ferrochelatase [Natronosalvus halobius]USZ70653.1 bifunctional precorrin-2 dehydrogenase/sirohydrochlorin ferrochelatase [Natronosalvus halobius]
MIPLFHDFTDATVLVFGGGPVGARKARRFAREAQVYVVSPDFAATDFGDAERIRAAPDPPDVAGWLERHDPALVVAATDDEAVNDAVVAAARDRGVLVNRADRAGSRDPGSVVVPATVQDPPVTVAVGTGGTAPALSKYLRQELEDALAGAGEMATLLAELRAELKAHGVDPERRRQVVTDVVNTSSVWTALRTGTTNHRQVIDDVLAEERLGGESR